MSYSLAFTATALKEWRKLAVPIQQQFKKRLAERLLNPQVPSARLYGQPNRYKIKLNALGYRLVYQVQEQTITRRVIAVGKWERLAVYHAAARRLG